MLLRALRFLDTLIQRDNLQKAAFLKDLGELLPSYAPRVRRTKVLPALLRELHNESLQPLLLPVILRIVQQQSSEVTSFPLVIARVKVQKAHALSTIDRMLIVPMHELPMQ